jgi:SAM-dependent MidA family methyltransferase
VSELARRAIGTAIEDHGPISFAEFMQLALYGEDGFYERPPVGIDGAFVTSPHVHPIFGELLARALRELWSLLGEPDPFRLAEVGAGDGTLARQVLDALVDVPLHSTAVEVSPGARRALETIDGLDAVVDEMPAKADVVVAHELLDNMPFRLLRGDREIRVGRTGDRFVEIESEVEADIRPFVRPRAEGDVGVPVAAFSFIDRLAIALRPGYALIIDYGEVGATGGRVHGYRAHTVVEDVLADPGSTDITVGIDFAAIKAHASALGMLTYGPVAQRDALLRLGFDTWTRAELARQARELDARDGAAAARTWSGRSRASLLVDPAGLGRTRWLVLASPALPEPAFIKPKERPLRS